MLSPWALGVEVSAMDTVSGAVRSKIMRSVRQKDTGPETLLRKALHARGFRYRKNLRSLPGSPDLVFPGRRAVIFVHGCFWHRHPGCRRATTPKSNAEFWQEKFQRNVERDACNVALLREGGWRVGVVWECEIGKAPSAALVDELTAFLKGNDPTRG